MKISRTDPMNKQGFEGLRLPRKMRTLSSRLCAEFDNLAHNFKKYHKCNFSIINQSL